MGSNTRGTAGDGALQVATFGLGDTVCGIDILHIQEINKLMDMTAVPKAPDYVRGILNLRGQIVTVIDLQKKMGLAEVALDAHARNIIVNSRGEHIGLLVGRIGDVVRIEEEQCEAPPANIGELRGDFFAGVFKTENELIGILELERVLSQEK